jgi:hypothetical protein
MRLLREGYGLGNCCVSAKRAICIVEEAGGERKNKTKQDKTAATAAAAAATTTAAAAATTKMKKRGSRIAGAMHRTRRALKCAIKKNPLEMLLPSAGIGVAGGFSAVGLFARSRKPPFSNGSCKNRQIFIANKTSPGAFPFMTCSLIKYHCLRQELIT